MEKKETHEGKVTQAAKCNDCGHEGFSDFVRDDGTRSCPRCGSHNVHVFVTVEDQVTVGDDLEVSSGNWMDLARVIDKEIDLYEETVTDPKTGEVIHHCKEKLSEHRNHGSAKTKEPRGDATE